jgi:hypothetical protein
VVRRCDDLLEIRAGGAIVIRRLRVRVPTGVCAQPAQILARMGDAGGRGCEPARVTELRTRPDRIAIA